MQSRSGSEISGQFECRDAMFPCGETAHKRPMSRLSGLDEKGSAAARVEREIRHASAWPTDAARAHGPRPETLSGGGQAACTNCICVPASSITSPFFKPTVSPASGVLLTVGRAAPSTWAST